MVLHFNSEFFDNHLNTSIPKELLTSWFNSLNFNSPWKNTLCRLIPQDATGILSSISFSFKIYNDFSELFNHSPILNLAEFADKVYALAETFEDRTILPTFTNAQDPSLDIFEIYIFFPYPTSLKIINAFQVGFSRVPLPNNELKNP